MYYFRTVRNFLIIFVLSAYLFSTTELAQLLKIPILISHFIEHKESNSETTFWSYLVHHYEGHEMDEDWETDMRLPFMQPSDTLQILIIPTNFIKLPKKNWCFSSDKHICHYKENFIPASPLESIWQPPKYC